MIQPQGVDEDDVVADGDVLGVVVATGGRSVLVVGAKVVGGTKVGLLAEGLPVEAVGRLPEGSSDPEPPHPANVSPAARSTAIAIRRVCPFIGYI